MGQLEEANVQYQECEQKHKSALAELETTDRAIISELEGQVKSLNEHVKLLTEQVTRLSQSRYERMRREIEREHGNCVK